MQSGKINPKHILPSFGNSFTIVSMPYHVWWLRNRRLKFSDGCVWSHHHISWSGGSAGRAGFFGVAGTGALVSFVNGRTPDNLHQSFQLPTGISPSSHHASIRKEVHLIAPWVIYPVIPVLLILNVECQFCSCWKTQSLLGHAVLQSC